MSCLSVVRVLQPQSAVHPCGMDACWNWWNLKSEWVEGFPPSQAPRLETVEIELFKYLFSWLQVCGILQLVSETMQLLLFPYMNAAAMFPPPTNAFFHLLNT